MFKVIAIILIVAGIITIAITLLGDEDNDLISEVPQDTQSVQEAIYFTGNNRTEINGFSYTYPAAVINDYFDTSNWPPIITEVERRECQAGLSEDGYEYITISRDNGYCLGGRIEEGFDPGTEINSFRLYGETGDGNFVQLETGISLNDCLQYGPIPNECIIAQTEVLGPIFQGILIYMLRGARKV